MSASREKKQRQGGGLSEKALQAQQQQAARKRKTVIYTVIGVVFAVLVAALLVWRSSRNGIVRDMITASQAKATAATVGGKNLSVAELSYYYYSAHYSLWETYYVYGLTSYIPADTAVMDQETGRTYRDYYLETALKSAQENMALADVARNSGHSESEIKDSLNTQIQRMKASAASSNVSYSTYLKAMYGSYMSAAVFEKLYVQDLMAGLAYSDKRAELLDSYSEADLKAYYDADDHADSLDTFEYSYLYFTPAAVEEKDKDGNTRDEGEVKKEKALALTEAKANAEAAKKALEKDGSVSDLVKEYELDDADYADDVTKVGASDAPSAIREKLLSMKDGDVELVENGESGYYVVTLHSRTLVEDLTRDVRHILIRAETTTDGDGHTVAPTDAAWAAAKEKIEAIQAEYEAGARTEDSFAALANEKSDDGNGTTGGLYEGNSNGDFVVEFNDWVFDAGRQIGDVSQPIRHEGDPEKGGYWGYHLIYYVGENDPAWKITARYALTAEDLSGWLEELRGNYQAALTGGADNIGG